MSAIDDIVQAIDQVLEKVSEASASTAAAEQETEQALGTAVALGATGPVDGLTQVKELLEGLAAQLGSVSSAATEARTTAQAVAEST